MSKYTVSIRNLAEFWSESDRMTGANNLEFKILRAQANIFDFDYPVYSPTQKREFELMFIRRFWRREIGYETVSDWKMALQERLLEIMPKYIVLYEREEKELPFDNFYTVLEEKGTGGAEGSYTTTGKSQSETQSSDMPQGALDNFRDDKYLTSADKGTNTNDSKTTQKSDNQHQTRQDRHGNNTIQLNWHADMSYTKQFKTVHERLLDDLNDLFVRLW